MDREDLNLLTQSRFYSPALNAAIFDGPVRIYFDQNQEAGALKLYFAILKEYKELCGGLQSERVDNKKSIFIMIYPNAELFRMLCDDSLDSDFMLIENLGEDQVIALKAMPDDLQIDDVIQRLTAMTPILPEAHPTPV